MAFLTFNSTNHFHGYTINLFIFNIVVKFLVNAIEFIAFKLHFCVAVAVNTPAHT